MIALLILAAVIAIPFLARLGGNRTSEEGLDVVSGGQTVGQVGAATPEATSTPTAVGDVQSVVDELLSGPEASASPAAPASAATPAAASAPVASGSSSAASTTPNSIQSYTVKAGDTVQRIASSLGVSARDLRASNQLFESDSLQVGKVLYASKDGLVHTIKSGQTLSDISVTYGVSANAIAMANGIATSSTIFAGSRLVIPGASSAFWDTVDKLAHGRATLFSWPLEGEVVSTYGWRDHPVLDMRHHHDGIDLDVPEGTTVYASAPGEVYYYGEQPGYGNVLILEHATNYYTLYGHLSSSLVRVGQYVERSQRVALTGNTGISSGPHLHFELRNGEFPLDPLQVLPVP
ncbi:MAG: M23 family metallopeptidase [Candidatus Bipolaricaulota bacterium]